jgi:hypothetical protein
MEYMMGPVNIEPRSLQPWPARVESNSKPIWKDRDHETPFSAICFFVMNWPGAPQTSERSDDVRHARLMQIIGGYPEISTGIRPLDDPLHTHAALAFKLSRFLDQLSTNSISEWHSLRSYLLMADFLEIEKSEKIYIKFLHTLMGTIRQNSDYKEEKNSDDDKSYDPKELHPDEVRLITALHSHNHERRGYWPEKKNGVYCFHMLDFEQTSHLLKLGQGKRHFQEHEFKFNRIQWWLEKWSGLEDKHHAIHPDAWHNLMIGASVFLESALAKMRSKIISKHGVGSIVIDGGGRLSYLSKKSEDEEEKWFNASLNKVLLFDDSHIHPYHDVIQASMEKYSKRTEFIFEKYLTQSGFEKNLGSTNDSKRYFSGEGDKRKIRQKYFEFVFREDFIKTCLPEVVRRKREDEREENLNRNEEDEREENLNWEQKNCILCNKKCSDSGILEKMPFNTPGEILAEKKFVCPFHYVLFDIGKRATVRLGSRTDLYRSPPQPKGVGKEVQSMIMFDGNSIGGWFTHEFLEYVEPKRTHLVENETKPDGNDALLWDEGENSKWILDYWNENKKNILDFNHTLILDVPVLRKVQPPQKWGLHEDSTQEKVSNILRQLFMFRRQQALIRRQRRSFNFNAKWWSVLRDSLDHMVPWVAAGDDIVLVTNTITEVNQIKRVLKDFHNNLQEKFPETPITFAGAVSNRGEVGSIRGMFYQTRELEKDAGFFWKQVYGKHTKLPKLSLKKEKELDQWLAKKKTKISLNFSLLVDEIQEFQIGDLKTHPIPSLLLVRREIDEILEGSTME